MEVINCVNIIGRLVKDVIPKTVGETKVGNFTLAVDRPFAKENDQQADFLSIIVWGKTCDFCEKYFKKGLRVGITGRIQTRTWEKDGTKHYATEIIAEKCYFADGKKDSSGNSSGNSGGVPTNEGPAYNPEDNDELPF